jgi:hypothetical protein
MSHEQQCEECKVVLYSFKNGIASVQEHKASCSRRVKKDLGYFNVGDRVRRKKEFQDNWWKYGDKVFTVEFVGEKSPEFIMFKDGELDEADCNVHDYKRFERVDNENS